MGLTERRQRQSVSTEIDSAGSANAAELILGPYRLNEKIVYNLGAANGDIVVEGSDDASTWEPHYTEAQADLTADGTDQSIDISATAIHRHARIYYTGNDGDINTVKLVSK